jgi:hypothetical protein
MSIHFKHSEIADLYALLTCPDLLGNGDKSYSETLAEDHFEDILNWDKAGLLKMENMNQKRIKRLGFYAEELLYFFLNTHSRFKVYAHNHQIIENKRTIGELDFVFEDLELKKLIHLELACKFYIQVDPKAGLDGFVGIRGNDTLGKKIEKMTEKQLQPKPEWFASIPGLDGRIPETVSCVKGRLFYSRFDSIPSELSPRHLKGKVMTSKAQIEQTFEHCHKLSWISGQGPIREGWPESPYDAEMFYSATTKEWKIFRNEGFA